MAHTTAYTYCADVYCEECAQAIMADVRANNPELVPEDDWDQASYDSGDWPKSYLADMEESDSPQHCADCGEFLGNPLTSDGYAYVKGVLDNAGEKLSDVQREWANFYGFSWRAECGNCAFDIDDCECERPKHVREWRSYEMETA